MTLFNIHTKKSNLLEMAQNALRQFVFDTVRIIGIEPEKNLFLLEGCDKEEIDDLFFAQCKSILRIIKKEKKALVIDYEFFYDNESYNKYDQSNAVEIYIPIFKETFESRTLIGIVYIASKKALSMNLADNQEFHDFVGELRTSLIARYDSVRKMEIAYDVSYMLCEIIDKKEPYLISRLFNIMHWCSEIAKEMGLPQRDINKLRIATLMHDLGKIYISEQMLKKTGALTDKEYEIMKRRVNYSYDIAKKLEPLFETYDLPEIILNYQERIDGNGYPSGKKGDQIPLLSKILYAAKAISAMSTNTTYSKAKTISEVIGELTANAGTQFDKGVVDAAVRLLTSEHKSNEACMEDVGTFATLTMKAGNDGSKENKNFWGNIRKAGDEFIFTPSSKMFDIDRLNTQDHSLYVSFNDQIIQYVPDIKTMSEDKVVLSHIKEDKDNHSLSLNWLMPAVLVAPSRKAYEIFVTLIGGECINFYIFKKDVDEEITKGVVSLTFDDGNKATLPGTIVSSTSIEDKMIYRLEYIGISHDDMKMIFAQLFKKQIQLRNMLRKLK